MGSLGWVGGYKPASSLDPVGNPLAFILNHTAAIGISFFMDVYGQFILFVGQDKHGARRCYWALPGQGQEIGMCLWERRSSLLSPNF